MINKKYIHLLNYFASKNLFAGESKHVFMNPGGKSFELYSERQKTKDELKYQQTKLKERKESLKNYEKNLKRFVKSKSSVELKGKMGLSALKEAVISLIAKNHKVLPQRVRKTKEYVNFFKNLLTDIGKTIENNSKEIEKNMPCTLTLDKGGKLRFHNKKGFDLKVDLKDSSELLKMLSSMREKIKKLREKLGMKKQEVVKGTVKKKAKLKKDVQKAIVEEPNKALEQLVPTKSKYLVKKGKGFQVKFLTPKGKVDRKAESSTRIHDLFDLTKLRGGNIHLSFTVSGTTRGGRKFKHEAVYHKGAETFHIKGTTTRVRIYHNNLITNIKYEAGAYKPKETEPITKKPKTEPVQGIKTLERKPADLDKAREEAERKREHADALIDDIYYGYIFQNGRFIVPKELRDDKNFKNIKLLKKAQRYLEPILEEPPFKITNPTQARKYIQEVFQLELNSRVYAEDFFRVAIDGKRKLYKGGYKKFIKDYYRVEKQMMVRHIDEDNPIGNEEKAIVAEWQKLRGIALGIARIFNALDNLKTPEAFKVVKETRMDVYRPMLNGVEKIEKEPSGLSYYNLGSLLHHQENAPKSVDIGVSDLLKAKIKQNCYTYEIPGFNPGEMLKSNGGLKLLFMAFGLRKLLAEKCIKKVNDKKFVLVKLPKYGWLEAMATIKQTKARLWVKPEHAKADFKKWEKVRASLSQSMKARLFVRSIFTPTGSVVKENFNWWQGLWHGRAVWKKNKRITMAHLGEITINPKHFEKFMAQDRGYLDMIEKNSDRVPGTGVYQPNPDKILKKTNDYIEYGLTSVLMNMTQKNFHTKVPQLVKKLGIKDKIGMSMNELLNKNKIEILDILYKALKLNNIEPSQLKGKKELIKLIRVGYILGRRVETSKKWAEVMNKNLSTRPLERKAQLEALKNGCPIYLLKAVEQKVQFALAAISRGDIPANIKTQKFGAGMLAQIELFKINGQPQYFTVGLFGSQGKNLQERCLPFIGFSGAAKLAKKLTFRWMVGASTTFAGAAIGLETPIGKSDYNFYATISAGADYKRKSAGVGFGIGAVHDRERSLSRQLKENIGERKIKEIDEAIKNNNQAKAAKLILNHPHFGTLAKRIQTKFKIDNATIVDIYLQARPDWINSVRRNEKVPYFLGGGISGYVGVDLKSGKVAGFGIGAYITFKIPGTEVNYVIRHDHPKYSGYMQRKATAVELRKKLRKEGVKNFKIAPYVIKAGSGMLTFDSRMGRSAVARRVRERKANVASGSYQKGPNENKPGSKGKKGEVRSFNSTFELVKKTFSKLDIDVEMVPDPRNPKGKLLALTPRKTKDSNVEVLMDPKMVSRGLILDRANNRFLISANLAKDLYVTRSTYRYPFQRRGAMNLHVIAFKSSPDVDNDTLRNSSPWSLYKFKGERYQRLKNEALGKRHYDFKIVNGRPVQTVRPSNVLTLAEYKGRQRKFETFVDEKAEYTGAQGIEMSDKLFTAMRYEKLDVVRTKKLDLKNFSTWLYSKRKFRRNFNVKVRQLRSADGENAFKTKSFREINKRYKEYAKANGLEIQDLNEQEKNLIYAVLLDKSFTEILNKNKNYPNVINLRLKYRNRLFKQYMKKFITRFKELNPDQWKELQKKGATINGMLRYLVLCMPQNYEQLMKFRNDKNPLLLKAGIKYGSYTQKYTRRLESMPTGFGADAPGFESVLKMMKPTKLNVNSPDANERAAANLILRMMSPLPTKNLEKSPSVQKKFLQSELSQLLLSMYDERGISPLLPILGLEKFKGLINVVKAANNPKASFAKAMKLPKNKAAFNEFKKIVLGIRKAQLEGKSTFTYGKYVFHVAKTDIYAGPYLKCANGTVAVHQKIGITLKGVKRARLYGAKTDVNVRTGAKEKKAFGKITIGIYTGHKFKRGKKPIPPRKDQPRKTPVVAKTPKPDEMRGSGSAANPAPDTNVQGADTGGTGNL